MCVDFILTEIKIFVHNLFTNILNTKNDGFPSTHLLCKSIISVYNLFVILVKEFLC